MNRNNNCFRYALLLIAVMVMAILITGCGSASYNMAEEAAYDYVDGEANAPAEYAMDDEAGRDIDNKVVNGTVGEASLRHVIRNGSLSLTVDDTRETVREVSSMVQDKGGIVSSSNIYEVREGQYHADLTLRVPVALFDSTMDQLETFGKVTRRDTGMDDVTMHYIDLQSRLANQEAQEARLVEILDMAETVEEVLEVERELYRVRGEIESMSAQLTYLADQVSFSTIYLSLREETIPTGTISPNPFHNLGQRIVQAFTGSINVVLSAVSFIVLAFVAMIPVLILLGVIVLLIWLLIRKLKSRKKQRPEGESEAVNTESKEDDQQ